VAKSKKRGKPAKTGAKSGNDGAASREKGIARGTVSTVVGAMAALAAAGWLIVSSGTEDTSVSVVVPALSSTAAAGKASFERVCAKCHGINAGGGKTGPPLIHATYRPGHHGDDAFRRAIAFGTRQHHWKFGPMPPQPGMTAPEIPALIAYIREVQRANGVF